MTVRTWVTYDMVLSSIKCSLRTYCHNAWRWRAVGHYSVECKIRQGPSIIGAIGRCYKTDYPITIGLEHREIALVLQATK